MKAAPGTFSILILAALACAAPTRADNVVSIADQLTRQHLAYIYGSDDIASGGLDCSGFVRVVFRQSYGIDLPDEADKQLDYCRKHGQVWDSKSGWTPTTLQPGDLIFFAGPDQRPRESMVTHVMIYCGHNTMAGAQHKDIQLNGTYGGVGNYLFRPHYPSGIFGESGERFIGHRHVFAYARLTRGDVAAIHDKNAVASNQSPAPEKTASSLLPPSTKPRPTHGHLSE